MQLILLFHTKITVFFFWNKFWFRYFYLGLTQGVSPPTTLVLPLQSHGQYYVVTQGKYQENGDTLSDFVNLVCQEAHNSSTSSQVSINQPINQFCYHKSEFKYCLLLFIFSCFSPVQSQKCVALPRWPISTLALCFLHLHLLLLPDQ